MDLFQYKKAFDLLNDFFVRGKADVSRVPYLPSKTAVCGNTENYFPRVASAARGIPAAHLQAMLEAFEHSSRVNIHSVTVLAEDAVVCEASAPPYDRRIPHVTHSMCKSITGLAIGMLWDEGRIDLDLPAYRYLPAAALPARLSGRMKTITVRHLLTMTSGVSFSETGQGTDVDWVRAFFSSDVKFEPGSEFAYNSMNTYILSAIVRAVSGVSLVEYLRPRLFEPLHITNFFWESCPRGNTKGGWGLYLAQEDLLKIGKMCLDDGEFGGKRILSREWLAEACNCQRVTPEDSGDYNYAFQMWCGRDGSSFLFNGMLGQNVWVNRKNRIIVVLNAGNSEFFQQSTMLRIVEKYLGAGFTRETVAGDDRRNQFLLWEYERHFFETRRWVLPLPRLHWYHRLLNRLAGRSAHPLPKPCALLAGRRFRFPANNAGILPVYIRMMQNNHTAGMHGVSFEREGDRFFMLFDEGGSEVYRIEAAFYGYAYSTLTIRGEKYRVASAAQFAVDEDGRRLLKLEISFLEISHTRRVKFYFDGEDGEYRMRMREVPGKEVVDGLVRSLPVSAPRTRGIVNFVYGRINLDYILLKAYDKFEPLLVGEEITHAPALPEGGKPHGK